MSGPVVTRARPLPPQLRGRVFRGTDAMAGGLPRRVLRGPRVHHLFRDAYADAELPLDHLLRCRALALVLPGRACLAGHSAAAVHGVRIVDVDAPVVVAAPHGSAWDAMPGTAVHRARLEADERVVVSRLAVTSAVRTLVDLAARRLPAAESVVLVDALLARHPWLLHDSADALAGMAGRPGRRRAGTVLALADGRSESPMESRLRVHLTDAGIAPPELQWTVRDDCGRFVARVDLAWPLRRLAVEYDGLWHGRTDEQFALDRRRLDALSAVDWRVVHVTHAEAREGFAAAVARVEAALSPARVDSRPPARDSSGRRSTGTAGSRPEGAGIDGATGALRTT